MCYLYLVYWIMFLIVCSCYFLYIRAPSCVISSSRVFLFFRVSTCIFVYRHVSSCIVVYRCVSSWLFLFIFVYFCFCPLSIVSCAVCRVSRVVCLVYCSLCLLSCFVFLFQGWTVRKLKNIVEIVQKVVIRYGNEEVQTSRQISIRREGQV